MSITPFDFSPLLPAGLPQPAAKWTGLAKYNFTGGNNDSDELPLDGLIAATILVAAIAVSYRDLRQHYRVAPAIEDLTVACHGKPGWIPLQSLLFTRPAWVAMMEGKAMALALGKPFIAVNHLEGHALTPRLQIGRAHV